MGKRFVFRFISACLLSQVLNANGYISSPLCPLALLVECWQTSRTHLSRRRLDGFMVAAASETDQESQGSTSFTHHNGGSHRAEGKAASSRLAAVQAFVRMSQKVTSAVELLESNTCYRELSTQDRSFARLMVTTAERRMGQLDAVIQHCETSKKKSSKRKTMNEVDRFVQAVLRVGAVQLLYLGVAPHAAVKETVDVLRILLPDTVVPETKVKFVNAILRRLSREGKNLLDEHTSLDDNAACWLVKEWNNAWGEQATQSILKAAMVETPRCLSVRRDDPDDSEERFRQRLESVAAAFPNAEITPTGAVRVLKPPLGPI